MLQHFSLRHLQHIHAIPKARWGECAGKLALPFALTGAFWTPVSSEGPAGVQPTAVSGSFLAIFVCWRAKRGISLATAAKFWEATRNPECGGSPDIYDKTKTCPLPGVASAGPLKESTGPSGIQ